MNTRRKPRRELGDLYVASVNPRGELVMVLPGGAELTLHVPRDLARYYRRLVPDDAEVASAFDEIEDAA
jgi:hypothetical protein